MYENQKPVAVEDRTLRVSPCVSGAVSVVLVVISILDLVLLTSLCAS